MTEKQILVKDLKINYKVFGEGKPFLILHGWRSKSQRWENVAELLINNNLQVIIPDLPGFGESQEPNQAWNLDGYVEWLKEFCDKVPELNNGFYLLGHSFGGSVAAKFSIKYNQNIKKLFLVAASCVRTVTFSKKALISLSRLFKVFYFLPFYESFRKYFYRFILRKSDYPYVSGIMKEIYLKVIEEDLSQKLLFIKVLTTIIWGDKDDWTPIEYAHIINEKIPHSKLVIIPGAGHNLHINSPEILAEKVLENLPS